MKKQNLVRHLLMTALLAGGILAAGAGNNVYADDTGQMGSGGRTGQMGSGGRSGYIAAGTRTADAASAQGETESFFDYILSFLVIP